MKKNSICYIVLSLVLAVILMVTNISCGGDTETPVDPNTVAAVTEAPQPVIS